MRRAQLLTVCAEPLLRVWDVESGRLAYQIGEPHDTCEVSAVAFDPTGYRLASAAIDGSLCSASSKPVLLKSANGPCVCVKAR